MTKKDGFLCVYYRERAQVKKDTFSAVCANQSEKLIHDKERLIFMCMYGEKEREPKLCRITILGTGHNKD